MLSKCHVEQINFMKNYIIPTNKSILVAKTQITISRRIYYMQLKLSQIVCTLCLK